METGKLKQFNNTYNKEIENNSQKYVKVIDDRFKDLLKQLKNSGKHIFLISNNWPTGGLEILRTALGKDFKDYFDFIIFHAQKPRFMYDTSDRDFIEFESGEKVQLDQLKDKVIQYGDLKKINEHYEKKLGKFKGIIFEDNFYSGLENKTDHKAMHHWAYALVFKELGETEEEVDCDNKLAYKQLWGSQLIGQTLEGKLIPTFFVDFMNQHAQHSFSSMKSEKLIRFFEKPLR